MLDIYISHTEMLTIIFPKIQYLELHKFDMRPIEKTLASFQVKNYSLAYTQEMKIAHFKNHGPYDENQGFTFGKQCLNVTL